MPTSINSPSSRPAVLTPVNGTDLRSTGASFRRGEWRCEADTLAAAGWRYVGGSFADLAGETSLRPWPLAGDAPALSLRAGQCWGNSAGDTICVDE